MQASFEYFSRALWPNLSHAAIDEDNPAQPYLTLPILTLPIRNGAGAWSEGTSSNEQAFAAADMSSDEKPLLARSAADKTYGTLNHETHGGYNSAMDSDCDDVSVDVSINTGTDKSRCTPKPATCTRLALMALGVTSFGLGVVGSVVTLNDHPGPGKMMVGQGLSMGGILLGACLVTATSKLADRA